MTWLLDDIKAAYDVGEARGATHMIVAYDTFDGGNYPIYVFPGQNPREWAPSNGDRVDECYRYSLGWEAQSGPHRVSNWEWDEPTPVKTDARVPKVAQTVYEQERAKSNVAQFWPEWLEAPNEVRMAYEERAIEILSVVDSF